MYSTRLISHISINKDTLIPIYGYGYEYGYRDEYMMIIVTCKPLRKSNSFVRCAARVIIRKLLKHSSENFNLNYTFK